MARRIKGGGSKRERQIQPVISSLSVLHCLKHTKRYTDLGREEQGEGVDRGDPNEMLLLLSHFSYV